MVIARQGRTFTAKPALTNSSYPNRTVCCRCRCRCIQALGSQLRLTNGGNRAGSHVTVRPIGASVADNCWPLGTIVISGCRDSELHHHRNLGRRIQYLERGGVQASDQPHNFCVSYPHTRCRSGRFPYRRSLGRCKNPLAGCISFFCLEELRHCHRLDLR